MKQKKKKSNNKPKRIPYGDTNAELNLLFSNFFKAKEIENSLRFIIILIIVIELLYLWASIDVFLAELQNDTHNNCLIFKYLINMCIFIVLIYFYEKKDNLYKIKDTIYQKGYNYYKCNKLNTGNFENFRKYILPKKKPEILIKISNSTIYQVGTIIIFSIIFICIDIAFEDKDYIQIIKTVIIILCSSSLIPQNKPYDTIRKIIFNVCVLIFFILLLCWLMYLFCSFVQYYKLDYIFTEEKISNFLTFKSLLVTCNYLYFLFSIFKNQNIDDYYSVADQ